jgi:hypothetical protein
MLAMQITARHVIPNTIKAIKSEAYGVCTGLTYVTLGNGLEEHHYNTTSHPMLSSRVRCTWLMTVTLGNGLEEIRVGAFERCALLECTIIPSAIKEIDDHGAFKGCSNLMNVMFCNEIEKFVSCGAMQDC